MYLPFFYSQGGRPLARTRAGPTSCTLFLFDFWGDHFFGVHFLHIVFVPTFWGSTLLHIVFSFLFLFFTLWVSTSCTLFISSFFEGLRPWGVSHFFSRQMSRRMH